MRHELQSALRRIQRRPLRALAVALTLGLGIGSTIAVFGAADAILLRPLPYPDADRLVRLTQTLPVDGYPELNFSDVLVGRTKAEARSFTGVAAWSTRDANLLQEGQTRRLSVARVTGNLAAILGVRPAAGRWIMPDEEVPNGPRVLVLSDQLWRAAFNADSGILGQAVNLEGQPYTVIGIMDPRFVFPSRTVAAWEPLQLSPASVTPFQLAFSVVARLRPGATMADARADLTAIVRRVGREFPGPHPGSALDPAGYSGNVRPLATTTVGDVRPVVALLLTGVFALLLLTCANVANLQLAAIIGRSDELAVRTALGATRGRLIGGQVLEGIVLATAGGILGIVVAVIGARLVTSILPASIAIERATSSTPILVSSALLVLVVGAVVGAFPIMVMTRRSPALALRERAWTSVPAVRVRRLLATTQVALAVVLLHGSGLLLVSAANVADVDLGFQPQGAINVRINIPDATLRDRTAREGLLRRILADVSVLPGVSAAGVANGLPLTLGPRDMAMAVEGRPFKADGTDPVADFRIVSEGYFGAMGIRLTRGRLYTDTEASDRLTPLIINESLARRLFPDGEDPIGQRLRFGPVAPWMPIVGVVADAKNRSVTDRPYAELYTPALGTWSMLTLRSGISIVVRARGNPLDLATPIRRIIQEAAPDVAIERIVPVGEVVREANVRMTTTTRLITWYAAAALLIAVAGTYAVLSYLIAQRRTELAVRIALGAPSSNIVWLVARESASLVGVGAAIGLAGGIASARILEGMLYGVGTFDIAMLVLVLLVAITAGAVAAVGPVRRAVRSDPREALRGS